MPLCNPLLCKLIKIKGSPSSRLQRGSACRSLTSRYILRLKDAVPALAPDNRFFEQVTIPGCLRGGVAEFQHGSRRAWILWAPTHSHIAHGRSPASHHSQHCTAPAGEVMLKFELPAMMQSSSTSDSLQVIPAILGGSSKMYKMQ